MRVLSASGLAVCRVRYNAPFRQTWLSLAQHSRECAMLLKEKKSQSHLYTWTCSFTRAEVFFRRNSINAVSPFYKPDCGRMIDMLASRLCTYQQLIVTMFTFRKELGSHCFQPM